MCLGPRSGKGPRSCNNVPMSKPSPGSPLHTSPPLSTNWPGSTEPGPSSFMEAPSWPALRTTRIGGQETSIVLSPGRWAGVCFPRDPPTRPTTCCALQATRKERGGRRGRRVSRGGRRDEAEGRCHSRCPSSGQERGVGVSHTLQTPRVPPRGACRGSLLEVQRGSGEMQGLSLSTSLGGFRARMRRLSLGVACRRMRAAAPVGARPAEGRRFRALCTEAPGQVPQRGDNSDLSPAATLRREDRLMELWVRLPAPSPPSACATGGERPSPPQPSRPAQAEAEPARQLLWGPAPSAGPREWGLLCLGPCCTSRAWTAPGTGGV